MPEMRFAERGDVEAAFGLAGPSCSGGPSSVSSLPVATIALLGMQSQRCAAPPMMSRSINVTSAPSDAATVAAVFPPGPPPMITKRTATSPGYAPTSP